MNYQNAEHPSTGFFSKSTVVACIVLSVIGFLIYTGHSAHLMGFLPYLFILACPLMHVFMHHGHHHHHHHADKPESSPEHCPDKNQPGDR